MNTTSVASTLILDSWRQNPLRSISTLAAILGTNIQSIGHRNIFRVTGSLCGEFTGHPWIPLTKASDAELWCFLWSALASVWHHCNDYFLSYGTSLWGLVYGDVFWNYVGPFMICEDWTTSKKWLEATWLYIHPVNLSKMFCDIHLRAISKEVLLNLICKHVLQVTPLKSLPHLPGANEWKCIYQWV